MKRGDIYFLVLILAELFLLAVIIWFATHSEFVTHEEFLAGMLSVVIAMSSGFWAIWSKISELSREIGYIRGKINKEWGR